MRRNGHTAASASPPAAARLLKLSDLKPDPQNANRGTARGKQLLVRSLKQYGAGRSILIDRKGRVIAGNKTLANAKAAGLDDVLVVQTDGSKIVAVQRMDLDLKAKKAKELAIADNRVGELDLEWDNEILDELSKELDLSQFWRADELEELLGHEIEVEEAPEPQLDRAEELREKWGVKRGQIWEIGKHRLMCGDSTTNDVISLLNGIRPDLLHTDPPYGISIVSLKGSIGGSKPGGSTSGINRKTSTGFDSERRGSVQRGPRSPNQIIQSRIYPPIHGDDGDFDPSPFLNIAPLSVFWGANYYATKLPPSSCWICWDKREDITRNSFADCELAWCSADAPARVFHHLWNGLHKGSQYGEARWHPTEKPVALFREIGTMLSPEGIWIDLFAGSGSQLVAAEQVNATCFAMEYEAPYAIVCLERLSDMGLKPKLLSK